MEMCLVPAGEFLMGSADTDSQAGSDETPEHRVSLDAYYIGRFPVTNAQYARFVQAASYRLPLVNESWAKPYNWVKARRAPPRGKEQHPVVLVSWDDAVAFCYWVGLRLPTEAEWEKAASWDPAAQRKRSYPWGDRWDASRCNSREGGKGGSRRVGTYSPAGDSPYGCADMAGNVWEWCADSYDAGYYAHSLSRNPQGPLSGQSRALRGGSWDPASGPMRSAIRDWLPPDYHHDLVGFRCCLSAASTP
jgi:formylglycine-generating enzyme required for sulfatase activity